MPEPEDEPLAHRRRWWSRRRDEALAAPVDAGQLPLEGLLEPEPIADLEEDIDEADEPTLEERLEALEDEVFEIRDRVQALEDRLGHRPHRPDPIRLPDSPDVPEEDPLREAVESLKAEIEAVRRVRRATVPQDDD